jgi:hypothetical protein
MRRTFVVRHRTRLNRTNRQLERDLRADVIGEVKQVPGGARSSRSDAVRTRPKINFRTGSRRALSGTERDRGTELSPENRLS